jgi:hypothetical protein
MEHVAAFIAEIHGDIDSLQSARDCLLRLCDGGLDVSRQSLTLRIQTRLLFNRP